MKTPALTSEKHLQASELPCGSQNNLSNFSSILMNSKHTPEDVCTTIWYMKSAVSLLLAAWLLQGVGCQTPKKHWNKLLNCFWKSHLKIPLEIGHVKCGSRLENAQLHLCGVRVVGILGQYSLEKKKKKKIQWRNKVSITTDKTCYLRTHEAE